MPYLPLVYPENCDVLQLMVMAYLVGECQLCKSGANAYYSELPRSL
jgi:hypothetical protein